MKVFVTCGKHPLKSSGGYASYVHALCVCLKKMGHEVIIIAIAKNEDVEDSEIGKIYTVTSHNLPTESATAITGSFFKWSKIIGKKIQELIENESENYIIYGIGPWCHSGIELKKQFADKVKLVGIFFTTFTHETYWLTRGVKPKYYGISLKLKYKFVHNYAKRVLKKHEAKALAYCDKVVVHYDFTKNLLQEEYSLPDEKIIKIPYFVEIYNKKILYSKYDKKRNLNKNVDFGEEKKFTCVSICRQEPRKGIYYFLKAMKIIKEKKFPIKAKIVGSGDLLERNIEIAKKLGLEDTVQFAGFVPDINEVFSEADVFVHPTIQEGSGSISVFEALISNVPVITTMCDGLPEDIQNGISGILVKKEDETELANAIIEIFKSKELREKLVRNGEKVISEKCEINKMIDGLNDVHKKLIKI